MIRILHIITSLDTGGAENILYRLVSGMDCRNFTNAVVCLGNQGKIGEKILKSGIQTNVLGIHPARPNPLALKKLYHLLDEFKPDIIQGWMYHGNLVAQLAARRARTPFVWNIRQSLPSLSEEKFVTSIMIRLGAFFSYAPSRIIYNAFTSALHHEAIGYRREKRLLIPNGFDTEAFSPSFQARESVRKELDIPIESFLIGLIARYHPVKDHKTFFKAWKIFNQKFPEVHFVLAGKGISIENQELDAFLRQNSKKNFIHLLGEREDIPRITASLDIATCCSKAEALSNSIGEAMSCAVPCVATNVGDLSDLVSQTGLIIDKQDHEALAKAWEHIYSMPLEQRQQLGKNARERILSHYSLSQSIHQYSSLYTKLFTEV